MRVNARAQQKQGFITIVLSSYEALGLLDKMIIWSKVNFGVLTVFCEEEPVLQGAEQIAPVHGLENNPINLTE